MSARFSLPGLGPLWALGLYGETESREQFGLFGETYTGSSTETLGLFGDHCWTLSVRLQKTYLRISSVLG
jgi:hypothetical protein